MHTNRLFRTLIIGSMVLVAVACNLTATPTPTAELLPTADSTPIPPNPDTNTGSAGDNDPQPQDNPVVSADMTRTHIDSALGLAFDYPDGWHVEGNPGNLIQLFSPPGARTNPRPQGGGFPEDETKVEFIVVQSGDAYSTIDEYITYNEQNSNGPGGRMLFAEKLTLASGIPAARTAYGQATDGTEFPSLVIEHAGRLIIVTGYGDTTRFDEIVSTIRPA